MELKQDTNPQKHKTSSLPGWAVFSLLLLALESIVNFLQIKSRQVQLMYVSQEPASIPFPASSDGCTSLLCKGQKLGEKSLEKVPKDCLTSQLPATTQKAPDSAKASLFPESYPKSSTIPQPEGQAV